MFLNAWAPARLQQTRSLGCSVSRGAFRGPATLLRSILSHLPQENPGDRHIKPSDMGVLNFASDILFIEEATFQREKTHSG